MANTTLDSIQKNRVNIVESMETIWLRCVLVEWSTRHTRYGNGTYLHKPLTNVIYVKKKKKNDSSVPTVMENAYFSRALSYRTFGASGKGLLRLSNYTLQIHESYIFYAALQLSLYTMYERDNHDEVVFFFLLCWTERKLCKACVVFGLVVKTKTPNCTRWMKYTKRANLNTQV